MKGGLYIYIIYLLMNPCQVFADCLSGENLTTNTDTFLIAQTSFTHKSHSSWKIDGKNPYTTDNIYNDFAFKFASACSPVKDLIDLDFSIYALAYYPINRVGLFEKDNERTKLLIEKLRLTWLLFDSVRFTGGRLPTPQGAFFLRTPGALITNYYSGFKSTSIYDPVMKSPYSGSYWGVRASREFRDYTFSLTISPKLTKIHNYYDSANNWTDNQRANSSAHYLLGYTDYRLKNHILSSELMLGDLPSISLTDSYNYTPQFIINTEFAWHSSQQWRHFSKDNQSKILSGIYPSSLYSQGSKDGIEFALGGQYTNDHFSLFGFEYYFQSEGYSKSEWNKQINFIRLMNKKTNIDSLDQAFDNYKYLMGAEISNTSNKGMLQGKHYINIWSSLQAKDDSIIQPYLALNLMDGSALIGLHYSKPVGGTNDKFEIYTGMYSAQGSRNSEFALFGATVGIYTGFKYYL